MDDYVKVLDDPSLDITESLTIIVRVNVSEIGEDHRYIIQKPDAYELEIRADLKYVFINLWDTEATKKWLYTDPGRWSLKTWHTIAGVYKGATQYARIYVDEAEYYPHGDDPPTSLNVSANNLSIGILANKTLSGIADEILIFNKALTKQQYLSIHYRYR